MEKKEGTGETDILCTTGISKTKYLIVVNDWLIDHTFSQE